MSGEQDILLLCWVTVSTLSAFAIPRGKGHKFVIAVMVCQSLTWVKEFFLLHYGWISYPVREFPKASDMGMTIHGILFPIITALYVVYEPVDRHPAYRMAYMLLWVALLGFLTNLVAWHTRLLDYHGGFDGWWATFTFAVLLPLVNLLVRWFFRAPSAFDREKVLT